jgi:hypothetical protein
MKFYTTTEIAKKKNLTAGRIRQLAPKVNGAMRLSSGWIFPAACLSDPIFHAKLGRPPKQQNGRKK